MTLEDQPSQTDGLPDQRARLVVGMCTFRRNDSLRRLLDSIEVAAKRVSGDARVGVVVVDDSPDGEARPVAEEYRERFEDGVHYDNTASGNISRARNRVLSLAIEHADWLAMTDDDCVAPEEWLEALLATQRATGADAVTGPRRHTVPAGAPTWIEREGFVEPLPVLEEGIVPPNGLTSNILLSTSWLRAHEEVRFDEGLGVLGGEDNVFFGAASAAGMNLRYSRDGLILEILEPSRLNLRWILRGEFWMGNSEAVSDLANGIAGHPRLVARGVKAILTSFVELARKLVARQSRWRLFLGHIARGFGLIAGGFGIQVRHH
ncbi:MAG: glycosyltransferase family 2 protein [Acidimicrobiia bacterium]